MRVIVYLSNDEIARLRRMAESEMRGLREQARYLIVKALPTGNVVNESAQAEAQPQEAARVEAAQPA
jgi:hypothetical protein